MNPYDFVRINWNKKPVLREPIWHHRLILSDMPNKVELYSGRLEVEVKAETPLFILDPHTSTHDPKKAALFVQKQWEDQIVYILPGSSIKGLLRELVETLGNGCLTLFDGYYKYRHIQDKIAMNYERLVPPPFRRCNRNTALCIACRIFGMMGKESEAGVFLGKVNISDGYSVEVKEHPEIYTLALMTPKPHHTAFYLDASGQHIAGRKYYFHHEHLSYANNFIKIGNNPNSVNRLIQPLGTGTRFRFHIDFTSLTQEEFAILLLAIALESEMRHKIGYGKPMGLGSVQLTPLKLTLVDYAKRYSSAGVAAGKGKPLVGSELQNYVRVHIASFSPSFLVQEAITDLRRIWRWPPANVTYQYPTLAWFEHNSAIPIAQTP